MRIDDRELIEGEEPNPDGIIIQRPYIQIMGHYKIIDIICEKIIEDDILGFIPYPPKREFLNLFTNFVGKEEYTDIYIGLRRIQPGEGIDSYYSALFSDYFFDRLIEIVIKAKDDYLIENI